MAQFYTLDQAAELLRVTQDKLREMARSGKVRSFQDKNTLRFRSQDIDEMARSLGLGSDATVPVKKPNLNDADAPIPISAEDNLLGSSDFEIGSGKPPVNLKVGPATDSEVKLIPDSRDTIEPLQADSGPSLLGDEIGLLDENSPGLTSNEPGMMDLDLDAIKAEPTPSKLGNEKKTPAKPGSQLPTSSPFELSEADIDLSLDSPSGAKKKEPATGSSGDIDLAPESDSDFDLDLGSSEQIVLVDEDIKPAKGGASAGTGSKIQDPADSAISLEADSSGEMEFDLALDDVDEAAQTEGKEGSSSDFELTLDDSTIGKAQEASSSEFELTLDEGSSDVVLEEGLEGSDSEFELSIDEDGDLSSLQDSDSVDQVDGELFEDSDFEAPALDSDSESESIALNEGSSDFEIQMDESSESELDSDSEAVDLDDEPKPTKSKKKGGKATALAADSSTLDLDLDGEDTEEGEEEEEAAIQPVATAPASVPWGIVPTLMLLPSVIVLFVVGLMSFELLQGAFGYQKQTRASTMILLPIARMLDSNNSLPKD